MVRGFKRYAMQAVTVALDAHAGTDESSGMAETTRGPSFPPIVGAEMPTLVRAKDWAATPLGPMEAWSATLRLALEMVLSSGFPMALRWGPEFVLIYNDGYRPILGDKHPWALGLPAREAWSEVWDQLDPVHNEILSGQRGAVFSENTPLQIKRRRDQWENAFFTLSYSPIADPTVAAGIGGILVTAVETTDSMRGEAALRESDERLQRALSVGLGIGTWDWDVQNDRVVADARFARLYGVDPEHAARGAPIEAFFSGMHPGDRERVQASIASALGSGADFYEEYRLVRPDGSERWVAAQGRCMLGAEGKAVRFPGVTFDITSRKKSEARNQALLDLDNRLRSLEDVADVAFAAAEVLGRTLNVSRAGYGSIDLEAETITIERDWNAPGIESLAGVLKFRDYGSYIEELKQGRTVVIEDAVSDPRTASGAAALAGISALSLVNMPVTEQGGFVALLYLNHASARDWPEEDLVLVREVAERTRMAIGRRTAEHELRTLNANLERQILERSHVGGRTWQLSTDILGVANAEGFFESSNPAWQTILGWSREEVARTPLFDFIHPDDIARTQGALNQLIEGDPVFRFDNRYRTKTGNYRWLSWVAVPESGKFYCSARDVTIDKQRDEALAATVAERDRIWRNSRDLITVIDLRGILTSINPAVSAHLGWTPKDMIGRNVLEFIHPEDRPPLHDDTFIPERYAEPRVFFNRFLHKDGSWRHMSWLAALSEEQLIYSSGGT